MFSHLCLLSTAGVHLISATSGAPITEGKSHFWFKRGTWTCLNWFYKGAATIRKATALTHDHLLKLMRWHLSKLVASICSVLVSTNLRGKEILKNDAACEVSRPEKHFWEQTDGGETLQKYETDQDVPRDFTQELRSRIWEDNTTLERRLRDRSKVHKNPPQTSWQECWEVSHGSKYYMCQGLKELARNAHMLESMLTRINEVVVEVS